MLIVNHEANLFYNLVWKVSCKTQMIYAVSPVAEIHIIDI